MRASLLNLPLPKDVRKHVFSYLTPEDMAMVYRAHNMEVPLPDPNIHLYYAEYGNLELLRWSRQYCTLSGATYMHAALHGHLHIIEYLFDNNVPWDERCCIFAAKGGHLNVLVFAHENGCPWDYQVCNAAVEGQHLDVLQWAFEHGCPCFKSKITHFAVKTNNWSIIQYLISIERVDLLNVILKCDSEILNNIVLHTNARPTANDLDLAIQYDASLASIQWIYTHCTKPIDARYYRCAIHNSSFTIVSWLFEHGGAPWNTFLDEMIDLRRTDLIQWGIGKNMEVPLEVQNYIANHNMLPPRKIEPIMIIYLWFFPTFMAVVALIMLYKIIEKMMFLYFG